MLEGYSEVVGTRNQGRGEVQACLSQPHFLPALTLSYTRLRKDSEIAQSNLSYTQEWETPFYSLPKSRAGRKPPMSGCEMNGLQPVPSVGRFSRCPMPTHSPRQKHFWKLP